MGLGLTTGGSSGGDIKPYVNYDAKAGRMFRVDRAQQSDGTWATDKVEITNQVQFVADLANIRVGWVNYTTQGPVRRFVTLGKEPIPPRPDDKNAEGKPAFKQGFEIDLVLDKASGGGARVFGSAAGCVIEAMDALHEIARRVENFLALSDDPEFFKSITAPDYESFYWGGPARQVGFEHWKF